MKMNEFLKVFEILRNKNPYIGMGLFKEPGKNFYVLKVCRDDKEIFNVMGSDLMLLFQNAYGKLQVHRKELVE